MFTIRDCDPGRVWSGVAAAVADRFPGLPLVGYESGASLTQATSAGFTPVGPLRIWLRA